MAIEDKYISRTEARQKLGLRRDQMIYRLRRGHIKGHKVGYNWLIPVSELERVPTTDWFKAIRVKGEAPAA